MKTYSNFSISNLISKFMGKVPVALANSPSAGSLLIRAKNIFLTVGIVDELHTVARLLIAMLTSVLFRVLSGALVTLLQFLKIIVISAAP